MAVVHSRFRTLVAVAEHSCDSVDHQAVDALSMIVVTVDALLMIVATVVVHRRFRTLDSSGVAFEPVKALGTSLVEARGGISAPLFRCCCC